jgi:ubiquinone/menaquinone biosynthesis C-methylase UbiE
MAVEKTVISRGKAKGDSYYNRVAQNYEAKRTQQSWWHVEQDAMQELLAELPRGLEVVDIPFGTGRFVPFYQDNGYRVAGLDASADMIAAAQTALGDRFEGLDVRVGDAGALPFADKSFDLLVSTRFLRDIVVFSDAKKILREFARVTKTYAIIQLGHHRHEGFEPSDDVPMGGWLSAEAVSDLLAENGFRIIEKRHVLSHDKEENDVYHFLCKVT